MRTLSRTQSICPICGKPVSAAYVSENGKVLLTKTCKEHGKFESDIAEREEDFIRWTANPVINIPPKKALTEGADLSSESDNDLSSESDNDLGSQCPLHCGNCENHLQTACCVLIDVTDRCNQHCPYCFAKSEQDPCEEPSLLEIGRKYDLLLDWGEERTFNIQLSGGEPTVRDDLPEIIRMGRDKGFPYIQINTNGKRLAQEKNYAKVLKDAGAAVIFLQFDGTNDLIYEALRGEPLFEIKKKAIENCRKAGIPVTIVPTVVKNVNLGNLGAMIEFLLDHIDVIKGIHFQPVSFFGRHPDELPFDGKKHTDFENRVTLFDIMHELERQTEGKLKYDDFYPPTSGHTLCCFSSTYQKERDGSVRSLISYDTKSLGKSCCGAMKPLEVIKKDRNFVLTKWELSSGGCDCTQGCDEMDFDSFLTEMRRGMFSVSSMAFQDMSNLDAERLKRCRVHVISPDDRLIPFCAYNSMYRGKRGNVKRNEEGG